MLGCEGVNRLVFISREDLPSLALQIDKLLDNSNLRRNHFSVESRGFCHRMKVEVNDTRALSSYLVKRQI